MGGAGFARVAVPHNLVEVSGRVYGLDAYFWDRVEIDARKALMIRSGDSLTRDLRGCRVLPPRVEVSGQVEDLKSLASGLVRWSVRHARWKLARLLAPAPEPRGGWEYAYASRIAGSLRLGEARPVGVSWLVVEVRGSPGGRVEVSDRIYGWLIENDRVFSEAFRGVLRAV